MSTRGGQAFASWRAMHARNAVCRRVLLRLVKVLAARPPARPPAGRSARSAARRRAALTAATPSVLASVFAALAAAVAGAQAKRRLLARAMGKLLNCGAAMAFGTWVDMAAEARSAASSSRGRGASC